MEKCNCELWDTYLEWGTDETAEETMAGKLPNLMETISQQSSVNPKHNIKNTTPRHIIIKLLKTNKILKAAKGKRHYAQINKDKDDSRFLFRNSTSCKTVEKQTHVLKRKKK